MSSIHGKLRAAALSIIPALLAIGCAEDYAYIPAEQATAVVAGRPAARYAIPPEAPQGTVRVASFGVTDIEQSGDRDIAAVHVRLVVSNDSGAGPWTVDTRQIRADLRGRGDLGAPLVNTEAEELPVVSVPPSQERIIDCFFPLPPDMQDASDVPAFDVLWRVKTDTREVAQRTPFERVELDRNPPPSVWAGWSGSFWWYEPMSPPTTIIVERPVPGPPRYYVRPRLHR